MCARKRSVYTDDFKRQAVEMSEESGVTVKEVSAKLDISANLLYLWRKKYFKVNPVVIDQIELNGADSDVENRKKTPKKKFDHGSVDGRISELERKMKNWKVSGIFSTRR